MRGVLLPVALIFSVFVSACSFGEGEEGKTDSKGAQQALLVRVTRPEVRSMERRLPMTAKMTPLLEGEVVARVQGIRVLELLKDVGDEVLQGETLARLEGVDLNHALEESNNAVDEAQTKIDEAELTVVELQAEKLAHLTTVARMKQVWDRLKSQTRGVAQDDVDAAKHNYDTERARQARYAIQIKKAQATVKVAERLRKRAELGRTKAQRDVNYAKVTAPINGVITERLAHVGQVTMSGQAMYRLYDPGRLVARTKLAQHHLRHVKENQTVRFRGDAYPDVTFSAHVGLIEPQVDKDNAMVAVRLKLDAEKTLSDTGNAAVLARPGYKELRTRLESGRTLQPGMFVSGQIVLETRANVLTVKRKSIAHLRGQPYVYVAEQRNSSDNPSGVEGTGWRVRRLYFREGLTEEGHVEFLPLSPDKRLAPEDFVVLVGQDRLKDGDAVRVEGSEDAPPVKLEPTSGDGRASTNGKD
ncbi:MAG: efflux RND transporter periplasmic adaptor subunit [Planctomycetota bacterium]|nr:efflux RND transporter periplasmic adaptor subunit [Planctomycetota bacterium]